MKKLSLVMAAMLFLMVLSARAQNFSYSDTWGKAGFNLVDSKTTKRFMGLKLFRHL